MVRVAKVFSQEMDNTRPKIFCQIHFTSLESLDIQGLSCPSYLLYHYTLPFVWA